MTQTFPIELFNQTLHVPKTIQAYSAIRKIAIVRAKTILKKLRQIEANAAHLVDAYEKVTNMTAQLFEEEVSYYYTQSKQIYDSIKKDEFFRQSEMYLLPLHHFEQQIDEAFEQAKLESNLKRITDEIFTVEMLQRYYALTEQMMIALHTLQIQYIARANISENWELEHFPFQQQGPYTALHNAIYETPSDENLAALLFANPFNLLNLAIVYVARPHELPKLEKFYEEIGYPLSKQLIENCEKALSWFEEETYTLFIDLAHNPLFVECLETNAFVSEQHFFNWVTSKFTSRAAEQLTVIQSPDENTFSIQHNYRGVPNFTLNFTHLSAKGKWFKSIDEPIHDIHTFYMKDKILHVNQIHVSFPHFERTDNVILEQFFHFMSIMNEKIQKKVLLNEA